MHPKIALSAKMGAGKSTLAEGLSRIFGHEIVSIGASMKDVATVLLDQPAFLPQRLHAIVQEDSSYTAMQLLSYEGLKNGAFTKDKQGLYEKNESYRSLLQYIATFMRKRHGDDVWVRDTLQQHPHNEIICDDLRLPAEKAHLEQDYFIIRLDVSREEQIRRLKERYHTAFDESILDHPTETALDDASFHYRIDSSHKSAEEVLDIVASMLARS